MSRVIVGMGLIVAACGGGGGGSRTDASVDGMADAPPDGRSDARRIDAPAAPDANEACATATSYPLAAFTTDEQVAGTATIASTGQTYYYWLGIMRNGTPEVAILEIDLWPGDGVFTGMSEPAEGTYPLTGAELTQADCGVCVYLLGDLTIDGAGRVVDFGEIFFVDGGTVTISRFDNPRTSTADAGPSVAPDASPFDASPFDAAPLDAAADAPPPPAARVSGSFSGLTFYQLDLNTLDPLAGGCRTAVGSGSFDSVITP